MSHTRHYKGADYCSDFLHLKAAPYLLAHVYWGPGNVPKEISEAMACVENLFRFVGAHTRADSSKSAISIGDGVAPRVGALLALRTGWTVTSVDPLMRISGAHPKVKRLTCLNTQIERVKAQVDFVLACHSHAPIKETLARCKPGGLVVGLICCVPWSDHEIEKNGGRVISRILDLRCISPAREVVVVTSS